MFFNHLFLFLKILLSIYVWQWLKTIRKILTLITCILAFFCQFLSCLPSMANQIKKFIMGKIRELWKKIIRRNIDGVFEMLLMERVFITQVDNQNMGIIDVLKDIIIHKITMIVYAYFSKFVLTFWIQNVVK